MNQLEINTRNQIFYLLETLSSKQEQINYKKAVPFVHVPQELIQQWLSLFKVDQTWFKKSWSKTQLKNLKVFNDKISVFIDKNINNLQDIPIILELQIWINLMKESSSVLKNLKYNILQEIKHQYDALFHYKNLYSLLKKNLVQEETQACLEVLSRAKTIYLDTSNYNFQGFNQNYSALKVRGKINLKMETEGKIPLVKGFKVLYPNLENLKDENHRETHIITNEGLFMIHSDFNYTNLRGVLQSPRTIQDLQKKGFIDKEQILKKTRMGWQVKINVV